MTVQINCVKKSFITSDNINGEGTMELCPVTVYYSLKSSNTSLLIVTNSTKKLQGSCVKLYFITSYKVINDSTNELC